MSNLTLKVWPPEIRSCVVDLAHIVEATRSPKTFDLMAARVQMLLDRQRDDGSEVGYLRTALEKNASATSYAPGDVVDIARKALKCPT